MGATKNYQVVQQIMGPLPSSNVSPNNSLHPPFMGPAGSHGGSNKDLYHLAAGAAAAAAQGSPPWLDPHLREKCLERPMYGAAEKRAGFASRLHNNTSFEMMNGGELQVAVPNLYTRSLDRDPRLGTPEERAAGRPYPVPGSQAAAASRDGGASIGLGALHQFKSASFDVPYQHHHSPTSSSSHTEYDRASHHSASLSPKPHTPSHTPTRTPTPTLRVPSPARQTPPTSSSRGGVSMVTEKPMETVESGGSSVATLVGMKLDVCNVWLGSVRGKTTKPIILHEHGLKIPFYYRDTGG